MIRTTLFGTLADGREVRLYELTNAQGNRVAISEFGAAVVSIHVPDGEGNLCNVVAGYPDLDGYVQDECYLGVVAGRVANRIGNARFQLNGISYELAANAGKHHLHGGEQGFNKKLWHGVAEELGSEESAVTLRYCSPDGEEGYPGKLDVTVTYIWSNDDRLTIKYFAETDQPTPVNLTNHSYFNLAGEGNVLKHQLRLAADYFTPTNEDLLPTGELFAVEGRAEDFREFKEIGADFQRLSAEPLGYDHNFVLRGDGGKLAFAARVFEPDSRRLLDVYTTEPGVQFYTGNYLDGSIRGHDGVRYHQHSAFCLETQHFPDALNHRNFPSIILQPGEPYHSTTVYAFKRRLKA